MKKYRALSVGLTVALLIHTLPVSQVFAAPDTDTQTEEAVGTESEANAASDVDYMEYIDINTADDFLAFAENCRLDSWSINKIVTLKQDIDLTNTSFDTIPVFAGVFNGGGHTISGFRPAEQGYIVGLFRFIREGAVVKNLTIKGRIDAVDKRECIGSICGINCGTIKDCNFHGIVSGQNTVGGIAGINESSGSITKCSVNGRITGYYSTGGIVGTNHGIITFCNNLSGINDDSDWVEEDDEMGTGIFFSIQASEDDVELYSGVDTGGIAGYSDGLIERCNNYGTVGYEHTGYNIGGIAGRQTGIVLLCTNNGEVYGRKDVGGIVGQMEPDIEIDEAQSLRNAVNKLHDLIDKTLDDMKAGKDTMKADFDALSQYGDSVVGSGDELVGQISDFVDDNVIQIQSITERMEHIIDLLPDIMDDFDDSRDSFSQLTDVIDQLMKDLNFMDSLDDSVYDETELNRISLLSTVGGHLGCNSFKPEAGESVVITVLPNDGYALDGSLSIVDANGAAVSYINDNSDNRHYTFTMPSANVKVMAYFRYQDENVDNSYRTYVAVSENAPEGNLESNAYTTENHELNLDIDESDSQQDKETESNPEEGEDGSNGDEGTDSNSEDVESGSEEDGNTDSSPKEGESTNSDLEQGSDTEDNSNTDDNANTEDNSADNDAKQIRMHSNLSGDAFYNMTGDTVALTVRPDSAYTLNNSPDVTDAAGNTLPITRTQDGSYQYSFDVSSAVSPINVEINFVKQNKSTTVDTATDNIQASIQDFRQSSDYVNGCLQRINDIMTDSNGNLREWADLDDHDKELVIGEVVNLSNYLGQMSSSASSILSDLSTICNIMAPYMKDAMEAACNDIDRATDVTQDIINSIGEAFNGVRGIVNYMNAQPDIQFATLGPEFDITREDLHAQLMGISDSLKMLSSNTSEYSDIVNEDLKAVNNQLNVVFNLLADHLTDTAYLSVEELYEEVDEEDIESIITGKTDSCVNNGVIKGDINIGGIAGAMSVDEEDPEDNAAGSLDYQIGRRFITKCIITESINKGYVTAKKDGAGGIVGYMKHGIVTDSESYGNIESIEGDYVGGIAGESLTIIRNCYALCSVSGGKNVGGIAGYANTVQECYAIVSANASIGQKGAIAGEISYDEDATVSENYFVGDDIFGIDNISYAGIAEPISYSELLTVEHLPTAFWHLKVTYRIEDTYLGTQEVKFGESLANLDYPEIPAKEGFYGVWPDYSDQVMTGNLLIEGTYMDTITVVESSEKAESGTIDWQKPYALVEQTFTEDTVLNVKLSDQTPPKEANGKEYVIYDISLENGNIGDGETFAVRLLNPYGDNVKIWGFTHGSWRELKSKARGQYMQVEMTGPKEAFCIMQEKSKTLLIIFAVTAGVIVLVLISYFLKRAKRRLSRQISTN